MRTTQFTVYTFNFAIDLEIVLKGTVMGNNSTNINKEKLTLTMNY